jgi:hypothetical protein
VVRDVGVVCLGWAMLLLMVGFGWRCIPSSRIWCLTAFIPSFFWIGIFLLSLRWTRLMHAPCWHSSCLAVIAAFIARVQYCCVSRCAFVKFCEIEFEQKSAIVGHLLWAEVRKVCNGLKEALRLFIPKIAMALIMQGDVAVYPL